MRNIIDGRNMVCETTIEAYKKIKENGLLSKRRWEIYDILYHHGPMTSNETFDYSVLKGVDGYRHNANARMTELRDFGVAKEIGQKVCSKTGMTEILWDVTANLPVKPEKLNGTSKNRKGQIREHLTAAREKLRERLNAMQSDMFDPNYLTMVSVYESIDKALILL